MGTVGMAYNKRGATLNGLVLDKIAVENDETGNPVLLNAFLFNKSKRYNYSLICESFCTIGKLEFETMISSLRHSEVDYEFWKQFYDSDQALDEEWTTRECEECHEYHTLFNCPRRTYMPLRSMIFLKNNIGIKKTGLSLEYSRKEFEEYKTRHMRTIRERKNRYTNVSPLKFWKNIFQSLEKVLEINFEKNYQLHERFTTSTKKGDKLKKGIMKMLDDKFPFNEGDTPCDFEYYFKIGNPCNLIKIDLRSFKPSLIPKMTSV